MPRAGSQGAEGPAGGPSAGPWTPPHLCIPLPWPCGHRMCPPGSRSFYGGWRWVSVAPGTGPGSGLGVHGLTSPTPTQSACTTSMCWRIIIPSCSKLCLLVPHSRKTYYVLSLLAGSCLQPCIHGIPTVSLIPGTSGPHAGRGLLGGRGGGARSTNIYGTPTTCSINKHVWSTCYVLNQQTCMEHLLRARSANTYGAPPQKRLD